MANEARADNLSCSIWYDLTRRCLLWAGLGGLIVTEGS